MKKLLSALVAAGLLAGTFAQAGNLTGDPHNNRWNITTVKWIKGTKNSLKHDGRNVVLIGKVTKKIDDDTYLFNDGTGTIELDSDQELPAGRSIVIRGEIDQAWLDIHTSDHGGVEIIVQSWRYDKKM